MAWRLAKSLDTFRTQINAMVPKRSKASDGTIGNEEHSSRASDHNPNADGVVCAIDITHDPAHGLDSYQLAEHMRKAKDPRVKYIISNHRIANCTSVTKGGKKYAPWDWSPYKGANPHDHHVHVSVLGTKSKYDNKAPWDVGDPSETPDAPEVVSHPVLKLGSKGEDVEHLQELLAINPVDGKFGKKTQAAVKNFQKLQSLVADGVVGFYTWKALV